MTVTLQQPVQRNYEVEEEELKRKMAIAEAMMAQGLQMPGGTEMVGDRAVKKSPLEGIQKVLQAIVGAKMQESASGEKRALGESMNKERSAGIEQFMNNLSGATASIPGGEGSDAYGGTIQHKADPRKAILDAMASAHPEVRDLGRSQLKNLGTGSVTVKDLLQYQDPKKISQLISGGVGAFTPKGESLELKDLKDLATPESVLANPADPTKWISKRTLKPLQPGEMHVDDAGNIATPGAMPVPAGGPPAPAGKPEFAVPPGWKYEGAGAGHQLVRDPSGDLYQQSNSGFKKLDNATKITNHVRGGDIINKGEGEFMKKLGELKASDFVKVQEAKVGAQNTIQSMQKLAQLDKAGVQGGPTAEVAMFMGGVADTMGLRVDKAKLANSESYQGEVMANLSSVLTGSLARSTTDKDVQVILSKFPQLIRSQEGRAQLRSAIIAASQAQIDYADAAQAHIEKAFPEAKRLTTMTPGPVPVPQRSDILPPDRANQFRVIR